MNANQYPVTFPYGATSAPYSATRPHRGDDRACPSGTPIIIGTQTIGLTGNTGYSTGAHLHIQEWLTGYSDTRKPQNSFKGGIVTNTGFVSDFGNYITIKCDDGWNVTYAHLSKINVQIGQKVGVDIMTEDGVRFGYLAVTRQQPSADQLKYWIGRPSTEFTSALYQLSDTTLVPLMKIRDELTKTVKIKDEEIKKLQAQLAVQSEDTQLLNSFGQVLVKLITRLGLRK